MLDQDELIAQERENLKTLQGQWKEKLRKAEVDISVERAKIARDRAELEEKVAQLEAEKARLSKAGPAKPGQEKPTKGNWLSRLGLKEGDS